MFVFFAWQEPEQLPRSGNCLRSFAEGKTPRLAISAVAQGATDCAINGDADYVLHDE
jgi:hypothetical protein